MSIVRACCLALGALLCAATASTAAVMLSLSAAGPSRAGIGPAAMPAAGPAPLSGAWVLRVPTPLY